MSYFGGLPFQLTRLSSLVQPERACDNTPSCMTISQEISAMAKASFYEQDYRVILRIICLTLFGFQLADRGKKFADESSTCVRQAVHLHCVHDSTNQAFFLPGPYWYHQAEPSTSSISILSSSSRVHGPFRSIQRSGKAMLERVYRVGGSSRAGIGKRIGS